MKYGLFLHCVLPHLSYNWLHQHLSKIIECLQLSLNALKGRHWVQCSNSESTHAAKDIFSRLKATEKKIINTGSKSCCSTACIYFNDKSLLFLVKCKMPSFCLLLTLITPWWPDGIWLIVKQMLDEQTWFLVGIMGILFIACNTEDKWKCSPMAHTQYSLLIPYLFNQ